MVYINDAPKPWGLFFQDSASPQMEALIELHDIIFFYLMLILFMVGYILLSIIINFFHKNWLISNKYLNHGKDVPIQKCFNLNSVIYNKSNTRFYSTSSSEVNSEKYYDDSDLMKKLIIKDNKGKSGIYKWTNKLTNDAYIGQSVNLKNRFINYFNSSYLNNRGTLIINRALIKYGYSNFSLEILEYCDKADLTSREQYYIDKLNPKYNILKIAGSSSGYKHTEETKKKISEALKEIRKGENSYWYGRTMSEETKVSMSLKKTGENNHMYGKTHTEETKELIRQKALGKKHSEETKLKMSSIRGYPVYIYEKCDSEGFKLIGIFVSIRRAAKFLEISSSTVRSYINSGNIFKDRYKFSSSELK